MKVYRVLVTGSRDLADEALVWDALAGALTHANILHPDGVRVVVVHGRAAGADTLAARWVTAARRLTDRVEEEPHPAEWDTCVADCPAGHRRTRSSGGTYCPDAGPRRNTAMVALGADTCFAFPLPGSRGTWDCVEKARAAGIPVHVRERTG